MIAKWDRTTVLSVVGFAAVADGCDVDGLLVSLIEEHPVVAAAETEAGERRLELFHVTGAVGQVAIQAVKNCIAASRAMARRSARASGDQTTAIGWGAGGSVIYLRRTRAGYLHGEYLLRERAKRGHGRALLPFRV